MVLHSYKCNGDGHGILNNREGAGNYSEDDTGASRIKTGRPVEVFSPPRWYRGPATETSRPDPARHGQTPAPAAACDDRPDDQGGC